MSVEVRRTGEGLELELTGEWVAERFAALETALASVDLAAAQQLSIGTRRLTALDLSGAWVLRRFVRRARAAGAAVRFLGTQPDQLRLLDETLKEDGLGGGGRSPAPAGPQPLAAIGRIAVSAGRDLYRALAFGGRVSAQLVARLRPPGRVRPISLARDVYDTGAAAMPMAARVAFLISGAMSYMSA